MNEGGVGNEEGRGAWWLGTHVQRHARVGYPFPLVRLLLLLCLVDTSVCQLGDGLVEEGLDVFAAGGVLEEDGFVDV